MKRNVEGSRQGRLLAIAGGTSTLALCIFGGLWQQHRVAQGEPVQQPPKLGSGRRAPDLSPAEKVEYAERAKLLRAQFEPWARAHQADLRRMLLAGPNDTGARDSVWQALPLKSDKAGLAAQKMMPSRDPLNGVGFGWYPLSKILAKAPKSGGAREEMNQRTADASSAQLQHDFRERRDIAIAGAAKGQTMTYLWASGRVTQITALEPDAYIAKARRDYAEGRPQDARNTFGPHLEMAPPYDFLASSTGRSQ